MSCLTLCLVKSDDMPKINPKLKYKKNFINYITEFSITFRSNTGTSYSAWI